MKTKTFDNVRTVSSWISRVHPRDKTSTEPIVYSLVHNHDSDYAVLYWRFTDSSTTLYHDKVSTDPLKVLKDYPEPVDIYELKEKYKSQIQL
jgi:hypothetical protein